MNYQKKTYLYGYSAIYAQNILSFIITYEFVCIFFPQVMKSCKNHKVEDIKVTRAIGGLGQGVLLVLQLEQRRSSGGVLHVASVTNSRLEE